MVARLSDLGYTAQKLPGPLLLATTGGNRQVPKLMPPCTLRGPAWILLALYPLYPPVPPCTPLYPLDPQAGPVQVRPA